MVEPAPVEPPPVTVTVTHSWTITYSQAATYLLIQSKTLNFIATCLTILLKN